MSIRLHWSPDSANLPVRMALEMFGLPFEAVRVNRAAGDHRTESFRALNPQGLIPVLEDGDLVLFETGAILWHLAEKTGRLGPSGPKFSDDEARTAALKWMFYLSNTIHADLRIAFYTEKYIEGEGAAALRETVAKRVSGHFDMIEREVYDRIFGHPIILPDIYFSVLMRWAQLYPTGAPVMSGIDKWPTLQAICAKVENHPGAIKAFLSENIPPEQALTMPRPPDLPAAEITGH